MTSSKLQAQNNNLIVGYTTQQHLCLDLDQTSQHDANELVRLIQKSYPEVGDALLVISSFGSGKWVLKGDGEGVTHEMLDRDSFHVIFTDRIPYSKSCDIISTLAELDAVNREYVNIRLMRNDMTLRVSETHNVEGTKSAPMPMKWIRKRKNTKKRGMVQQYMLLWTSVRRLFNSNANTEAQANKPGDSTYNTRKERTIDFFNKANTH